MRWKFDEEEWKDRFNKAFDKALAKWRLSVTDCSMEHQTTSANKEVHEVDIVREKGYAVKVLDGSLERNLEEYEMEYAEKVFDGSPETEFTSTGTHLDSSALIHSHFNDYAKFEKGTDVGGYERVGTENWGCYKDGGSGGGPGQGRIRTIDLPRFDCTDSEGWIMRVEKLLYVYSVSESGLLEVVERAFVGDVLRWYQWENQRRPFRCWSDLKMVIRRQYSSSMYQNFNDSYGGYGGYVGRSDLARVADRRYGASQEVQSIRTLALPRFDLTDWEGWKYDPNTGQWYQVDGWDATTSVAGNFDTAVYNEATEVSYWQQTSQSSLGTVLQNGSIQSVTNWNQTSHVAAEFSHQSQDYNWPGSYTNYSQQDSNTGQPTSVVSGFEGNHTLDNQYDQTHSLSNQASQQNSFNYEGSVPSSEKASQSLNEFSTISGHQSFVYGGNFTRQYYQPQQYQSKNLFSYASAAGRSSDGRPLHALVSFGFGGKLIIMKDSDSPLGTSTYGGQVPVGGGSISVLNLMEVVASSIVNAQAQMLPKESPTNHQTAYSTAYSLPPVRAQIETKEADVQDNSKRTHALEKKIALVLEWGKLNTDVSENEKYGESDLKKSDVLKKQDAVVLKQLKEANDQVSSALCQLRQRHSYNGNLSLPCTRHTTNVGDSGTDLSSFNCFDGLEEPRTPVKDIIESSRLKAYMMVNSAIQAYASREGSENTFEKIEEAIDHVNDQLSKDYPYILSEGSFVAADAGNLTSQELFNPMSSSLQDPSSQKLKNPPVPSELITKCVATLLMIQNCTERQLPPVDVAQVLDMNHATSMLGTIIGQVILTETLTATGRINLFHMVEFITTFDHGGCEIEFILATFLSGERGKKVPELSQLNAKPAHHGFKTTIQNLKVFILRNITENEHMFLAVVNRRNDKEVEYNLGLDFKSSGYNLKEDVKFLPIYGLYSSNFQKSEGEDACNIVRWLWYYLPRRQWRPGEEQDEFQDKVVADEVKIGLIYACGRKEIATWERSRDLNSDLEDKVVLEGRSNVMHWPNLSTPLDS